MTNTIGEVEDILMQTEDKLNEILENITDPKYVGEVVEELGYRHLLVLRANTVQGAKSMYKELEDDVYDTLVTITQELYQVTLDWFGYKTLDTERIRGLNELISKTRPVLLA